MSQEVRCNGAGEMPGHEGEDRAAEHFSAWVDNNRNKIVEHYKESIEDVDDVPKDFINDMYENSFEVEKL